jgi:parallel beta-helix repeat protein
LTRDITAPAGSPAIEITNLTVAVDIDLNGFTIYGGGSVAIRAQEVDSLTIRNGTIIGGGGGIETYFCRTVVIEGIRMQDPGGHGMELSNAESIAVRRNIISRATGTGILVNNRFLTIPGEGTIEGNQIQDCDQGIDVRIAQSIEVTKNRINTTLGSYGIYIEDCRSCLLVENTVAGAQSDGINLTNGNSCKVYNNLVSNSGGDGIGLSNTDSTMLINNVSSNNTGSGLVVSGGRYNQIDRNNFSDNTLAGIWLDSSSFLSTYGRNALRGNISSPGPCSFNPPACLAPDLCDDGISNSSFGDNMGPETLERKSEFLRAWHP